jgi:hypothetical protein
MERTIELARVPLKKKGPSAGEVQVNEHMDRVLSLLVLGEVQYVGGRDKRLRALWDGRA